MIFIACKMSTFRGDLFFFFFFFSFYAKNEGYVPVRGVFVVPFASIVIRLLTNEEASPMRSGDFWRGIPNDTFPQASKEDKKQ